MKLKEDSIKWAISHNYKFSDTDLFPRPIEYDIINTLDQESIDIIKNIDIGSHDYGPARRFIVPKDEYSYRNATQLDPIDNILLTAILHEYGNLIESNRIPITDNRVFSYRFCPDPDFALYKKDVSWIQYWQQCKLKSSKSPYVVSVDIADFYNQIYHHTIENQLIQIGFKNEIKKWIMGLLSHITAMISRGIPIGPHSTNILAEMSLIPIDNSLISQGYDYCRYVDDFTFFCKDYDDARTIIYRFATILDKQQRMILQRQKTKIWKSDEFYRHCEKMIEDRPINKFETDIISIIKRHSDDSPYVSIDTKNLTDVELGYFNEDIVEKILHEYMSEKEPNYTRLRWFIRRLSQVGVPCGVKYLINNIENLTPALSEICHYLISVKNTFEGDWKELGRKIIELLKHPIIMSNEYFQITLLSIFGKNNSLNNIDSLIRMYDSSTNNIKRKILLTAYQSTTADWVRELKEQYGNFDTWSRRAFLVSIRSLPVEERKFFINNVVKSNSKLEEILVKWAKR